MLFFGQKKNDPNRPRLDWPWTLNLGGVPSRQLSWDILEAELRKLTASSFWSRKTPAPPRTTGSSRAP